jgi:hypothetical protein
MLRVLEDLATCATRILINLTGFFVTNSMAELNPIRSQFSESTSSLLLPACMCTFPLDVISNYGIFYISTDIVMIT